MTVGVPPWRGRHAGWVPADASRQSHRAAVSAIAAGVVLLAGLAPAPRRRRGAGPTAGRAPRAASPRPKPGEGPEASGARSPLRAGRSWRRQPPWRTRVLESTEPLSGSTSKQPVDQVVVPLQRAGRGTSARSRLQPCAARASTRRRFSTRRPRHPSSASHLKKGVPRAATPRPTGRSRLDAIPSPEASSLAMAHRADRRDSFPAVAAERGSPGGHRGGAFGIGEALQYTRSRSRSARLLPARHLDPRARGVAGGDRRCSAPPSGSCHGCACLLAVTGLTGVLSSAPRSCSRARTLRASPSGRRSTRTQAVQEKSSTRAWHAGASRMLYGSAWGRAAGFPAAARKPCSPASVGATGLAPPRVGPSGSPSSPLRRGLPGISPPRRAREPARARPAC